jgi:TonB-linked SusC/RagA family outer membrane protein
MLLLVSQSAETRSPRPIDRNSSITNPLITHMKKRLLGFVMVFLVIASSAAAQQSVSGRVTSSVDGAPLPGVSVIVKGTTTGTSTDADGRYTISVPDNNAVLVLSFIGFTTQEIAVGGRTTIDVQMSEDTQELSEVVVTALGIEREKKGLTYSVQDVKTQEISKAREVNVINSLSGKVAGISINRAGTGVGAATRVVLRGNRSLAQDSQPIYIVDGVPLDGDISDINPDDVESITVLKGANASALYGARGQNGVVMVNTKKGTNTGRGFDIDLSTTYMFDQPLLLTNYQNVYGQGSNGIYSPNAETSWGPKMDGQTVAHWSPDPNRPESEYRFSPQPDNVKDFFQTGQNFSTTLSVNTGTEKTQTYFSYTYTNAKGVVPTNELKRHNLNVRMTNRLTDKLQLDTKLNYIREDIDNMLAQGESFDNPMRHAYRLPRNIRTQDIERFQYLTSEGLIRQNYWNVGSNGGANPYWTINRNLKKDVTDRIIALASLRYNITKELSVQARSAIDRSFGAGDYRWYNDTYIIAQNGRFTQARTESYEWNSDLLVSYNKQINEDWAFNVNVGGNARKDRNSGLSANTGSALTIPNFFAMGNTQQVLATHDVGAPVDINSLYAFGQVSFKNAVFLDLTHRNDWSSTLSPENWSIPYQSAGLNVVVSDLTTMPNFLSFAKVRASFAETGNGTGPYQLERTAIFSAGGKEGFLRLNNVLPAQDLQPEFTKSLELGADLRFFLNRLGLDITWYRTNTTNQLFSLPLPVGSGASSYFVNGGDVQNTGIELTLTGSPIQTSDFRWDINLNFGRNVSLVKKIHEERKSLEIAGDFLRRFRIEEGKPFGEVYSRGLLRDSEGRVLIDGATGLPRVTPGFTVKVANYNPDWLGGMQNILTYKNFSFSFLIDVRQGGTISSLGNAIIFADGLTEETLEGREGGLIFGKNFYANETAVIGDGTEPAGTVLPENEMEITAESFWLKVGGRNAPVGEMFVVEASNIRFREAVLGYSLPSTVLSNTPFRKVSISFVGRNLFFISNKAKNIDPDTMVGTSASGWGYDAFGPPTARSYGFNLNLGF